jgi:mono/diheme cytochrome c family protein
MVARRVLPAAVSALCLFSVTACSDPSTDARTATTTVSPTPATRVALTDPVFPSYSDTSDEVAEGARLFAYQRCGECHSDAGVILGAGNGNIDVIATAIRDGRANGMPAYGGKLTDPQIWQIAAFVKALDARPDSEAVSAFDLTAGN